MNYDVLVVGSGIGGMESAIKLGDMGYKVLVVEKEASVGGKMILLSKVFPTLDCASCISTPKMAATIHHPNIDVMVYSEVEEIKKNKKGNFEVKVLKKPTFINPDLCTGCRECEIHCNVAVPDQFNYDMVSRRAAYITYPQAVPKKAVIDREGSSPCSYTCPAGIKAHGYTALVRGGKYDEAFNLVLDKAPLVGSLGRACYAPCEGECTRGSIEGTVPIRRIKRFIADKYYQGHDKPEYGIPEEQNNRKIAIVGSGPAGLTAAFFLAQKGYKVTIFEAASKAGGMLRLAIPSYRLPKDVLDRDIENITALGVEIKTGVRIENLAALKEQGFEAVFLATGTHGTAKMQIEGEDLEGITSCLDFLRDVNLNKEVALKDKTVLVVGGGNVAMDSARAAIRLGAKKVIVQYRRGKDEMPAHDWEIEAAQTEGIEFQYLSAPIQYLAQNGKLYKVRSIRMELEEADASGRRKPVPVKGSEYETECDLVITAIGLSAQTEVFSSLLQINKNQTLSVNSQTLQTSQPDIFAGGDVVMGPSMIVKAVGQGRQAAFYMDRFLRGESMEVEFDSKLKVVDKEKVIARQTSYRKLNPVEKKEVVYQNGLDFTETEAALTEEEARYSAGRCLDCGVCSECQTCVNICPANAIDLSMREEKKEVEVNSVIVSTGFNLFPAKLKPQYGYGEYKNVITGMQMDRLLAPTRPYNTILRPHDGKVPENIAYVLCTGSRDQSVNNSLCSGVCCMYSVKQNQLIMGALPLADVTVYYIDVRAFGKGYEEFYQQAKDMGANFIKGRVAKIQEKEDGNLALYYEDINNGGKVTEVEHDLVVLSVGLLPNPEAQGLFKDVKLETDEYFFVKEVDEDISPARTSIEGVFVAGAASGAKDIPDSILHAGAAAAQAAAYVERTRVIK